MRPSDYATWAAAAAAGPAAFWGLGECSRMSSFEGEEEPARECSPMSDEDGEMDFEAGMRGPGDDIMTYPGSFPSPGTCHLGVYH
jgi:hypothetical protein